MSRPRFLMDFANREITDLGKAENDDPNRYGLILTPEEVTCLRDRRCVIISPGGKVVWDFVSLQHVVGGEYVLSAHKRLL